MTTQPVRPRAAVVWAGNQESPGAVQARAISRLIFCIPLLSIANIVLTTGTSFSAQVVPIPQPPAPPPASNAAGGGALGVDGAIGEYTVHPGETLVHHLTVSLGSGATSGLDMMVDGLGLGQGPDGATIPPRGARCESLLRARLHQFSPHTCRCC